MARNPAAFQEMLRSQDRQLSNIEVSGVTTTTNMVCFAKHMEIHEYVVCMTDGDSFLLRILLIH